MRLGLLLWLALLLWLVLRLVLRLPDLKRTTVALRACAAVVRICV